ncbi:hypothetical protein AZE42_10354 [Rhizopogon vesiculosus]|uniref:Uncharacterized protein n=1 Tax=Rhizopogon vesiculosus TaxID=180088 RepID=A0A1J8QID5_9AGAM|nr:hypothetical protein AZE42_10354 [Rhizopogon vesiculosus]
MLTMSDATGFGSGGTTTVLTVGAPIANNNCNTTVASPDFTFELPTSLQQCNGYTFTSYDGAVQPITITALIPGGEYVILNPPNGSSYNWVADVEEGTDLVFFMMDSQGRSGGISDIEQVSLSSDSSCLNVNSPSSTASAPSQTSSQSAPSTSSITTNVGIIAGAAVGGVAFLGLMTVLGICCKRKMSRSSDTMSLKRQKELDYEGEEEGYIHQNYPFQYQTDRVNHISLPIQPGSQSHPTTISTNDPFTEHLRQISYTGNFAGSLSPNRRMTIIRGQPASPNPLSYQTLPIGLASPTHPGTHSHLTNASAGDFAVSDPHTPFSQLQPSGVSSNIDGLSRHGDDVGSPMSLPSRQITAIAGQTPPPNYSFPYQMRPASHPAPPIQPGSQSHHTSTGSFAVSIPASQTQPSYLGSNTDEITGSGDAGSSLRRGRTITVAAQTAAHPPAQIIMHTDLEDVPVTPDAQDVVELPPQYTNRRSPSRQLPSPQPESAPRRKSPRAPS